MQDIIKGRPEIELLLLRVSPVGSGRRSARIRQLVDQQRDWRFLQDFANSHNLLTLLCGALKTTAPDSIPPSMAEEFQRNTRACFFLTSELLRILELFDREGIAAIPFKGPTLAVSAYKNLTLPSFTELSIAVEFLASATAAQKAVAPSGSRLASGFFRPRSL
jgi:hypothetical protein